MGRPEHVDESCILFLRGDLADFKRGVRLDWHGCCTLRREMRGILTRNIYVVNKDRLIE